MFNGQTDQETMSLLSLVRTMEKTKQEANMLFNLGSVSLAHDKYTEALALCPWATLYNAQLLSNRGACHLKLNKYNKVVEDCSAALDLSPKYIKALLHRVCAPCNSCQGSHEHYYIYLCIAGTGQCA